MKVMNLNALINTVKGTEQMIEFMHFPVDIGNSIVSARERLEDAKESLVDECLRTAKSDAGSAVVALKEVKTVTNRAFEVQQISKANNMLVLGFADSLQAMIESVLNDDD